MYPKLIRRARIIRLAVVSLAVFCLAYTGVRAINFKSPNLNPAQSTSRDGVVILFQSIPGLAREQTLRLKFLALRPNREFDAEPTLVQVRLLDAAGNAVSETRQITLPPDGFGLIDFKRSDVALPGDSLTGRVETIAEFRTTPLWGVRARGRFNYEVFDDLTGKTTVAGQPDLNPLP
jgi:hypothetical protein